MPEGDKEEYLEWLKKELEEVERKRKWLKDALEILEGKNEKKRPYPPTYGRRY